MGNYFVYAICTLQFIAAVCFAFQHDWPRVGFWGLLSAVNYLTTIMGVSK